MHKCSRVKLSLVTRWWAFVQRHKIWGVRYCEGEQTYGLHAPAGNSSYGPPMWNRHDQQLSSKIHALPNAHDMVWASKPFWRLAITTMKLPAIKVFLTPVRGSHPSSAQKPQVVRFSKRRLRLRLLLRGTFNLSESSKIEPYHKGWQLPSAADKWKCGRHSQSPGTHGNFQRNQSQSVGYAAGIRGSRVRDCQMTL